MGNIQIDALSEDDTDIVIQGLDAEMRMLTADLNECLMRVNNKYEDRSQMTENARESSKKRMNIFNPLSIRRYDDRKSVPTRSRGYFRALE